MVRPCRERATAASSTRVGKAEKKIVGEKTALSSAPAANAPGAADGTRGTHCMRGRRRFAGAPRVPARSAGRRRWRHRADDRPGTTDGRPPPPNARVRRRRRRRRRRRVPPVTGARGLPIDSHAACTRRHRGHVRQTRKRGARARAATVFRAKTVYVLPAAAAAAASSTTARHPCGTPALRHGLAAGPRDETTVWGGASRNASGPTDASRAHANYDARKRRWF